MSKVIQGLQRIIFVRNEEDTDWLLVPGAVDVNFNTSRQTQSSKTQTSESPFADMATVGFSQLTVNVTGLLDTQTTHSLHTVAEYDEIFKISMEEAASRGFRIVNPITTAEIEGLFVVSEYSSEAPEEGLISVNFTLQSNGDIDISGHV